jgi:dihydropteroate synthase
MPLTLACRSTILDLGAPVVMGVLNVTPDSFSDGAIIDVGGESTRPGAAPVTAAEEIERVVPVIERLAARSAVPISIDTSKPAVMRAAIAAGARIINDVRALRVPGALEEAASSGAAVCLMHMQGDPGTMQASPRYDDVVSEVGAFLLERVAVCRAAGIDASRICIDPGIGFGKRPGHNLVLLARLRELADLQFPVLVGVSRKSLIGIMTGRAAGDRLAGSMALAAMCVERGASIIRAHDVAETLDALGVVTALMRPGS